MAATPRPWPLPAQWLLVAVGYLALGKLGLLLAIPPGYATALFPPAGLALHQVLTRGPRVLPGIWLGSFAMNLWVSWSLGPRPTLFVLSALLAAAAAAQSWVGAWLVRRRQPQALALRTGSHLLAALGLGGGLACLLGATFGVGALRAFTGLPIEGMPYAWWTWYVGDVLGVILTVPALQMALASRGTLWWERRLTVGLPLALSAGIVVLLFLRISRGEVEAERRRLQVRAEQVSNELMDTLRIRLEFLQALDGLLEAVPDLDGAGFERFVAPYLARHRDLHSVDWSRRVPRSERAGFESEMTKRLGRSFQIQELGPAGHVRGAEPREEHWPVTFKHPLPANQVALGLDLRTRPLQAHAMEVARREGLPALSVLQRLVQDAVPRPAMVLTLPVYRGGGIPQEASRRLTLHRGFLSVLCYVDPILEEVAAQAGGAEVVAELQVERPEGGFFEAGRTARPGLGDAMTVEVPLELFGTRARIRVGPSVRALQERKGWQVFLVLAGGLGFTGMLGSLLLLGTAQVHEARGLAEDRGRSLQELEARAKVILDHAVEPILTLDRGGLILGANAAAERLFGVPSEALLNHPISERVPGLLSHLRDRASLGAMHEMIAVPLEGEPIPLEVGLNAVVLDEQTLFTAFLRDLRERRRVERLKNEFIAVVSHELRTPLTSIRGTLGLLEGGVAGPLPPKAGGLVHIAHENAVRLGRLVDDILDLEKLEQGKLRLDCQPTALAPLLEQALAVVAGTATAAAVRLTLVAQAPPKARARVDGARLVQVLANLLSNAIKHSPAGGEVHLGLERAEGMWRVEVRDQGPGVPESFHREVFEKFTQADPSEDRIVQGTGLGLAISRSLVERMEGRIGFENPPTGGACFYVELPEV